MDIFLRFKFGDFWKYNQEYMHSQNSILYLENEIYRVSSSQDEKELNRIMLMMSPMDQFGIMTPMMSFEDELSGVPLPEFYEQYPIYVEDASQMSSYKVYKVLDPNSPEAILRFYWCQHNIITQGYGYNWLDSPQGQSDIPANFRPQAYLDALNQGS